MNRIAIVHFQPLLYYPPVLNFLSLIDQEISADVKVYTTAGNDVISTKYKNIVVTELAGIAQGNSMLNRFWSYFKFNIGTLLHLFYQRPQTVLYYESYSAFPAIIYSCFFRKARLLIHYHEYLEKDW